MTQGGDRSDRETEEGRGIDRRAADREKWHIRRIRESIQRSDSPGQDFPSYAWEASPALNTQASQDTEREVKKGRKSERGRGESLSFQECL